ncbi:uncharacterized protein LOC119464070 [Dermacentor silvarum]|uniref:uncharacterized protein LOC119464070 n=1 Tax=Dermacentor silvarum TaxID=543639 RepID=UPI001899CC70|nr:uncharacterized protein LOC119464070 [Dermacentor silvarum]
MQYIAVALATVCFVVVSGYHNCTNPEGCESPTCSDLEVPVFGNPRQDKFCRPLYAPPSEVEKLRTCLCKKGYVRNSWDECVPRKMCMRCKFRWQRDFHTCASGCPATCNRADDVVCQIPCAPGCECPPGWKQHPVLVRMCIRADKCPRRCPRHSSVQECVSSCAPRCGKTPPLKCVTSCGTPSCVCDKGYTEYLRAGVKSCVPQEKCSRLIRLRNLFLPKRTDFSIDRGTSFGSAGHLATETGTSRTRSQWRAEGLSPLFEESRVTVLYNGAPVEHYPRAPARLGTFASGGTARYGGVDLGFHPWPVPLRSSAGLGWSALGAYPLATASRVTAGYGLKGYGVYPWATPLGFPHRFDRASSVYFPWGTPLRGTIGYGWAGYGIYPWGTPLLVTPVYGGSGFGFRPWGRLSSGVPRYDGSGF